MTRTPVVHAAPEHPEGLTPCCDQTRFDLAWSDGLSEDLGAVTCRAKDRPPCTATIQDQHQGLVTCTFNIEHWDESGPLHGGPRGVGGSRLRWADVTPGATPRQPEHGQSPRSSMKDTPPGKRTARERLTDAVLHRGPGYGLAPDLEAAEAEGIRERYANAIRDVMLLGLQDAELHDEPGRERILEWVDWISKTLAEVRDREEDPEWRAPGTEVAARFRSAVAGEPEGGRASRQVQVTITNPDEFTANRSALSLVDWIRAEFPGVRVVTDAQERQDAR